MGGNYFPLVDYFPKTKHLTGSGLSSSDFSHPVFYLFIFFTSIIFLHHIIKLSHNHNQKTYN